MAVQQKSTQRKTLHEYMQEELSIAGFDFIVQNSDIIAWPKERVDDSIYLQHLEPDAYAVLDGKGFFASPGRQKAFQNQVVIWVYEYWSGATLRGAKSAS